MAGKAPSRFKSGKAHLSKPYEKPKSILHKVANTVKDLLLPSWLTASAWTAGPENEDVEQEDGPWLPERRYSEQDDVTDRENTVDHVDEGPEVVPFAGRGSEVQFGAPRDGFNCSFVPREMPSRLPSASTPVPASASQAVDGPVLMNGDSHSENSEASGSTSGCSSLVPSSRLRDAASSSTVGGVTGLSLNEAALERLRHDLSSRRDFGVTADLPPPEPSHRERERSQLWSEELAISNGSLRHPQYSAPVKRSPSFSLSTFATSVTNNSTKGREETRLRSPFYEGRTTYGGAAAYRRYGLVGIQGPYESHLQTGQAKAPVQCKRAKGEDDTTHMSNTTRRILQSLEKVATPLSEAKKVPLDRGLPDPILSYTPASQRRRLAFRQKPATPAVRGPPNTSFARPIPVRLERNLDAVLTPKSSASPREPSAAGTAMPNVPVSVSMDKAVASYPTDSAAPQDSGGRGGGKMRAQVVQHPRPSLRHRKTKQEEVVQAPDLPNVALPITTLPSFSFRPPPTQSTLPAQPAVASTKTSSADAVKVTESKSESGTEFQFSAPVYQEEKEVSTPTTVPAQTFSFSKPTVLTAEGKATPDSGSRTAPSASPTCPPAKRKASPPASQSPSGKDVVGPKAASQLVLGGSVMDVLGKSPSSAEKRENGTESDKNADRPSKSSESANDATETTPAPSSPQALWEKFKPAAGSWSCPTCMISNTSSTARCVACETPKPGSSSAVARSGTAETAPLGASPSPATSGVGANGPGFGSLFKPRASSWECDTCLVRNKGDATKCIACEVPRPGAVTEPLSKSGFSFKFGVPATSETETSSADSTSTPSSGFKFGVPSSTPASSSSTGFKFGVPASASEQGSSAGFKFGVPATTTSAASDASAGFKFGTATEAATANASAFKFGVPEPNKETLSVKTKAASTGTSKDTAAKTGITVVTNNSDQTDSIFKFGAPADSKKEEKDGDAPGETAAKKPAAQPLFMFGSNITTSTSTTPALTTTQKQSEVAPAAPVSGFSFQAAPKATEKSSGFSFPVTASAPAEKAGITAGIPTKAPALLGFSFGAPPDKSAKEAVAKSCTEKADAAAEKGIFSFGTEAKKPAEGATRADGFRFENPAKKHDGDPKTRGFSLNSGAADKGGFSFGTAKPAETLASKGGFTFGAVPKSDSTAKEKGGFTFGIPAANTAAGGEAPKSGFSFGVPAAAKAAEGSGEKVQQGLAFGAATPAAAKAPTFSFGGQQTSEVAATTGPKFVFGQKSETSPGTFTFGAAPAPGVTTTTQSSTPAFNFKPSVPAAAASSQPAFSAKPDAPQASPFTFGGTPAVSSSAVAAPSAVFSFGSHKPELNPAAPQPAASVFSFGASAHSQAPAAGAAAPSASQPVFSFGASQAAPSAPAPQVFAFGASSSTPAPFGSTTPAAQTGAMAPPAGTNSFAFPSAASPFGASQSQGAATVSPFGASQPQPASAAQFGASQSSQGASAPSVFGAAVPQPAAASASGFAFRPPAPTAAPAFQFGSSAPGGQEVFRFGAQAQSQEPQAQQPSGFNFNPPVAGAANAFGQQVAPSFNFGTAGASPAGFQFQAGADNNPFSATGTGAAPGRRIRKAVRRKPPSQR